jgi:hypothetical protein
MLGILNSQLAVVAVRRLAWAMGTDMGKAADAIVMLLSGLINSEKICTACRDKSKCVSCAFKSSAAPPPKMAALLN